MSNCWVDLGFATMFFACGANPVENHPASIAHLNLARFDTEGRGRNAALIVVDPRQTRTARMINAGYNPSNPNDMRKHDRYVRIRPGTNIAFINGVMKAIIDKMYAAVGDTSHPYHNIAKKFFAWHNNAATVTIDGTPIAVNSTINRAFLPDNSSEQVTLSAALLAQAEYSFDGGKTWQPTSALATGYPKWCDSRIKVDVATGDYKRAVMRVPNGSGGYYVFSNFLVFANDVSDPDCVFQKLREHLSTYDAATVAEICECTADEIDAVANAFIENSRFASSDFGKTAVEQYSAGYRATNIMYAMGGTQFTTGSQGVRSFAMLQAIMGNMGRPGGGINALRGIHNVQGSTDMGVLFDLIPGYSGNPGVGTDWKTYVNSLFGHRLISKQASVTIDCAAANSDLVFTAKPAYEGHLGNTISVEYQDPGASDQPLSVAVSGTAITVSLATDSTGAIVSTAAQVKAAIEADSDASALVSVAYATNQDGSGVVEAKPQTFLRNGTTSTRSAYTEGDLTWQQRGFFNMTREWFGSRDVPISDIDKLYACWPKGNGYQHSEAYRKMISGEIKAAVVWGMNPAVTEPNQSVIRQALENLDVLVVADVFATETAQCKRKSTGVTYLLPAAPYVETAGSASSSGRWVQWRDQARRPRGNSKSDIELLLRLAKALNAVGAFNHIKNQWVGTPLEGRDPFEVLYAKYGWDGTGEMEDVTGVDYEGNTLKGSEYVAEQIFKEMASPLDGYSAANAPAGFVGGHKGTIWIYSGLNVAHGGAYNPDQKTNVHPMIFENGATSGTGIPWDVANRAKSRKGDPKYRGASGQYHRYGWAWLLNRRVMYNNTEVTGDVADLFVAPGFVARLWCIGGTNTFAEWSWVFRTYSQLADMPNVGTSTGKHKHPNRFPAYCEPFESPYDGTVAGRPNLVAQWGRNTRVVGGATSQLIYNDGRSPLGQAKDYPLVLTTIRCVEHFQGGPITRNNPWNVEMEPEPWIEINSVDALKYGIKDGDYVNVITARSNSTTDEEGRSTAPTGWAKGFKARVGVGTLANQRVAPGVVAIPWHWGERGLGVGSRANDLTHDAWDANTFIPEYKVLLCRIEKIERA